MLDNFVLKVDEEELENWQLDKMYKQVYHKAVHKKQQAKKTKAKIREKILRVLIETMSAGKVSDILQLAKVKPGKEVHDQLTKLALKRPDVKAGVLKQVLETEQQQEASLCDVGQESNDEDTAEQTVLEDLRNAEGDEMGQSNVSQEESVILMSPAREGDNAPFNMTVLSDERLEEYYRSFGGRGKNPRRPAMERFV